MTCCGSRLDAAPDEVAIVRPAALSAGAKLDQASAALASGYRRLGLEPGDRLRR